jgi:hypothetical protein
MAQPAATRCPCLDKLGPSGYEVRYELQLLRVEVEVDGSAGDHHLSHGYRQQVQAQLPHAQEQPDAWHSSHTAMWSLQPR